ncbi:MULTISPECIES: DUF6086 family protein [unclassified Kribbella]|uniref:DUF6086 family protein n=1 Tax=unclassified Kribbella TaxID=2644121 RepID=UPI00340F4C90
MSQYYRARDILLWNPSSGVSGVFRARVRLFEDELSLASGVGPMESDACAVDVEQFGTFAAALLTYRGTSNHQILRAMMDGFVITVLALAERAGVEVRPSGLVGHQHDVQVGRGQAPFAETEDDLRQRAHAMLRFMPR